MMETSTVWQWTGHEFVTDPSGRQWRSERGPIRSAPACLLCQALADRAIHTEGCIRGPFVRAVA